MKPNDRRANRFHSSGTCLLLLVWLALPCRAVSDNGEFDTLAWHLRVLPPANEHPRSAARSVPSTSHHRRTCLVLALPGWRGIQLFQRRNFSKPMLHSSLNEQDSPKPESLLGGVASTGPASYTVRRRYQRKCAATKQVAGDAARRRSIAKEESVNRPGCSTGPAGPLHPADGQEATLKPPQSVPSSGTLCDAIAGACSGSGYGEAT